MMFARWRWACNISTSAASSIATSSHPTCCWRKPTGSQFVGLSVVKILDLGLARLRQPAVSDAAGQVTGPGAMMIGTLDFMAPEQAIDFRNAHLAPILRRMMAKKPEQRFQTPAEVAGVLAAPATHLPAVVAGRAAAGADGSLRGSALAVVVLEGRTATAGR